MSAEPPAAITIQKQPRRVLPPATGSPARPRSPIRTPANRGTTPRGRAIPTRTATFTKTPKAAGSSTPPMVGRTPANRPSRCRTTRKRAVKVKIDLTVSARAARATLVAATRRIASAVVEVVGAIDLVAEVETGLAVVASEEAEDFGGAGKV